MARNTLDLMGPVSPLSTAQEDDQEQVGNRLADLVHYIVYAARFDGLGATKLNRVLWFSDVISYRRYGQTITGLSHYVKNRFGPVPRYIEDTLTHLKEAGKITEHPISTPKGTRRSFHAQQMPDVSAFTAEEIGL